MWRVSAVIPDSPAGQVAAAAVLLGLVGLVGLVLAAVVLPVRRADAERGRSRVLAAVTVLAGVVLLGVTAWLVAPGAPANGVDAVRSAAYASGAVLALYALWLNDQRRRIDQDRLRTEEARRDIEDQRREVEELRLHKEREQLEYERGRAIEDRFAKAVELLGHRNGQTKVGALTMLAGLALDRPAKSQEVLDQLCAYLRWPGRATEDAGNAHVRLTAQRFLVRLLAERPPAEWPPAPPVVDLTGARLVDFALPPGTTVDELRLDGAELAGTTTMAGVVAGTLSMVGSRVLGELDLAGATVSELRVDGGARFADRVNLSGARLGPRLLLHSAVFEGSVRFVDAVVVGVLKCHARFERQVDLTGAAFRAERAADPTSVLLDLSNATFRGVVVIDQVALDGVLRLDGAVFEGGLVLRPGGAGVWADNVLVAEDAQLVHPGGWRTARSVRPGLLVLSTGP